MEPTVLVIPNSQMPSEQSEPQQTDNTPLLMLSQQVSNLLAIITELQTELTEVKTNQTTILEILENLQAEVETLETEVEPDSEAEVTIVEAELPPIMEAEPEKPQNVEEDRGEPNWAKKLLFG